MSGETPFLVSVEMDLTVFQMKQSFWLSKERDLSVCKRMSCCLSGEKGLICYQMKIVLFFVIGKGFVYYHRKMNLSFIRVNGLFVIRRNGSCL